MLTNYKSDSSFLESSQNVSPSYSLSYPCICTDYFTLILISTSLLVEDVYGNYFTADLRFAVVCAIR